MTRRHDRKEQPLKRNAGRAAAALLAVGALLVVLLAAAAWWWFAMPQGPRLAAKPARPEASSEETAFPAPVDAAEGSRVQDSGSKEEAELAAALKAAEGQLLADLDERARVAALPRHGRVVAVGSGAPIEGAEVAWLVTPEEELNASSALRDAIAQIADTEQKETDAHRTPRKAVVRCDRDGRFTLQGSAGDEWFVARAAGFGTQRVHWRSLSLDAASAPTIELDRECRLEARVVGRKRAGVAGVEVVVATARRPDMHLNALPDALFTAITDVEGRATIAAIPGWTDFTVLIRTPTKQSEGKALDEAVARLLAHEPDPATQMAPIRLAPGTVLEREWQLEGGVAIDGRLLGDGGEALADELIWIVRGDAKVAIDAAGRALFSGDDEPSVVARDFTDGDGRFAFADLPAGRCWIGPAPWTRASVGHANHDIAPVATLLELREEEEKREVVLHAPSARYVAGRTVDRRGAPVTGTFVVAPLAADLVGESYGYADNEGNFRVGPLAAGEFELRFTPSDPRYAKAKPLRATAGSRDLVIEVADAASLLVIARVGGSGAPVAASFVLVQQGGDGTAWVGGRGAEPASDDRFDGLPPGTFALGATTRDGFVGALEGIALAEGETRTVELALDRGATVVVRYAAGPSATASIALQSAGAVVAAGELARGATKEFIVPAGRTRLRVGLGAATVMKDLDLAAGAREEVVVDEREKR